MAADEKLSIYKASRYIKRKQNSLFNALRSIYEDSIFVGEIKQLWPDLPVLANLRCGLWYSPQFESTCYFKSTDGHCNNWSFNTSRLNLHVVRLAGQSGGCIIVDSTRKGKRFPDSMAKTIPIWTCVLNRAIVNYVRETRGKDENAQRWEMSSGCEAGSTEHVPCDWDCSLHLPLWVSGTEKAAIEDRLEDWTRQLEASGADIGSLASILRKPLRPLWISQKTVIWLNEVPDYDSWGFTPIILVSASSSSGIIQQRSTSEYSWQYIPGAGDDEESWARGLSPNIFWKHVYDLLNSGPDLCNQMVADIVEKDRVYRAQRGEIAPQVTIKSQKSRTSNCHMSDEDPSLNSGISNDKRSCEDFSIYWLGPTKLAVAAAQFAATVSNVDCILNCDNVLLPLSLNADMYLHLPILGSKFDRFSLLRNLPSALNFAKLNLSKGRTLLVCCCNGEDISICVCLAILISLYDDRGSFDGGNSFNERCITKWDVRRRLVFICKFAIKARPSRGNLKQVFNFLTRDGIGLVS
ncbi:uncharacterized protein C3F10.06c isoform X2 [Macadamia integrifolia]|uniref:uncharacterized protein C3F10.06c isoform X2 n=1 Tax=Macadamia integrifolia TaxID=60698 RepID=UPI001C4F8365|nr:uncharacterized protein C3F10.06c isoform X2 [Macadamia integrifolia]